MLCATSAPPYLRVESSDAVYGWHTRLAWKWLRKQLLGNRSDRHRQSLTWVLGFPSRWSWVRAPSPAPNQTRLQSQSGGGFCFLPIPGDQPLQTLLHGMVWKLGQARAGLPLCFSMSSTVFAVMKSAGFVSLATASKCLFPHAILPASLALRSTPNRLLLVSTTK